MLLGLLWPTPAHDLAVKIPYLIKATLMVNLAIMAFSMKTNDLLGSALRWKEHLIALIASYGVLPVALVAAGYLFPGRTDLQLSMALVGAVPCTLASASIWTRLANGNDALALSMTIVSNVLNCLLGPLVLRLAVGEKMSLDFVLLMKMLLIVVVLPVTLGQLARSY